MVNFVKLRQFDSLYKRNLFHEYFSQWNRFQNLMIIYQSMIEYDMTSDKFRIIAERFLIPGKAVFSIKSYYQCFFVISTHPLQTFFNGSFIKYLLGVFLNSKIFTFLTICCFLKCFFSHTFWTLLNSSVIVTNDTFNTWLSCLSKFTFYCCNKVSSQIIFEPNIEFFYLTMKQEKDWTQKLMITKCLYLKFQENFKISFCISANDLFINT